MKDRQLSKKFLDILQKLDWREIEGFAKKYYTNHDGDICSITSKRKLHPLKAWTSHTYLYVKLKTKDGQYKNFRVNRLVCQAYHINSENKPISHHKNHIRTDNRPDNLSWATYRENAADRKGRSNKTGGN